MKTNEKRLKALLKEAEQTHPVLSAILRERIVKIMEITMDSIEKEPEKWNSIFVHPNTYKMLNDLVTKHLGFEEEL